MKGNKKSIKKILQWILKILLSGLALYLVYKKIDRQVFLSIIKDMDWLWLFPAIILFNISKIFSSMRLAGLLENIGIKINHQDNLKLYYKGMFYSLFLPGGIGGDVYKTYVLNRTNETPLKKIIGTMLYDRISGLIILIFLAGILASDILDAFKIYVFILVAITIPIGYIFTRLFFPSHKNNFKTSQFYSFGVQLMQLLSVICILKALQVKFIAYFSYLLLFMVSSIAAVVPVTIGGAGARELVFLYGTKIINLSIGVPDKKLMNLSAETGIAIGLIFFLITSLSSLIGIFMKNRAKQ